MKAERKNRLAAFLRRDALALLLTAGMFWLTYEIVYGYRLGVSDYLQHTVWAIALTRQDIIDTFLQGKEQLWHVLVKLVFNRTHNLWISSAVVTAAANAAAHFLVFKCLDEAAPDKLPRWLLALLTHVLFIANALTLPGFLLTGDKGYMNMWHNPTNMMVRPFAAAVFFMTLKIYNRRRCGQHRALVSPADGERPFAFSGSFWAQFREPVYTWPEVVLYPVCLVFSMYAKPAFLQFFAPAIFLFFLGDLFRTRGMLFPFCLKLALAFLPAMIILFSQFADYLGTFVSLADAKAAETAAAGVTSVDVTTIGEAMTIGRLEGGYSENFVSSGVAVYFIQTHFSGVGEFLWQTLRAVFLTLCLCAFPLAVYIIDFAGARRSAAFRLSLWGVAVARIESLILHELGTREGHGNFRWAYFIAVWLFWAIASERYGETVAESSRTGKLMRWIATPLLLWQTATGVAYAVQVLATHQYWI